MAPCLCFDILRRYQRNLQAELLQAHPNIFEAWKRTTAQAYKKKLWPLYLSSEAAGLETEIATSEYDKWMKFFNTDHQAETEQIRTKVQAKLDSYKTPTPPQDTEGTSGQGTDDDDDVKITWEDVDATDSTPPASPRTEQKDGDSVCLLTVDGMLLEPGSLPICE